MDARAARRLDRGVAFEIVTASARPELADEAAAVSHERWPAFIFHDPVTALSLFTQTTTSKAWPLTYYGR